MKIWIFISYFLLCSFCANAYWQQHTATTIQVELNDQTHFLHGFEKIVYTNNSPDTLQFIYFHLWPNAYKNDRTAFCEQQIQQGKTNFYYAAEKDKGYIDSLDFSVDGQRVEFYSVDNNIDITRLKLAEPLLPGKSIEIQTPFRVKIPKVFSRLGHKGQGYFISQWFPKPAVYDHKGWHPMPYLDQGEFYSEYGSYDVSIKLPENYIVMATGNCQTATEINWMDSISKLEPPVDTMFRTSFPKSSTQYKTIRFTEDNVHDFAWFADKRWILRQDTVSGDGNDGVVKLFAAFLPIHQKEWAKANDLLKATVNYYGTAVGKYPYKTIKAAEGDMIAGAGMEYPTVTIIDRSVVGEIKTVIVHEAGHNWFYGMLGSNERAYPWMDEGLNSFYENKTIQVIKNNPKPTSMKRVEDALFYYPMSVHRDQQINLPSDQFTALNYGVDVYVKTSKMLQWLEAYIGKENFEKGMKAYFSDWEFKHPYPENFRKSLQSHTNKNLDWFFDRALSSKQTIDLKVHHVTTKGDSLIVTIRNKSEFAAPAKVSVFNKDTILKEYWTEPFIGDKTIHLSGPKNWTKLSLPSSFFDLKLANNEFRRKGLFHKNLLKLKPVLGVNRSAENSVFLSPSLGYNIYNGFGLGILFHNLSIPQNRFQFAIAPQYSFCSKSINGVAAISYSWFPKNVFQEIRLQTNFKSFAQGKSDLNIETPLFARYYKFVPGLELIFKEKTVLSKVERKLILRQYNINEEHFDYSMNPVDSLYRPTIAAVQNTYALIRYEHKNARTFHPFSYNGELQLGKTFVKLGLEAKMRIDYDVKKKSLYLRAYAGKFINIQTAADNSRYWLNTNYSGINDYLYDGTYLGRNKNEGLLSQQISIQEGGFKMPTNLYSNPLGRSNNWLIALNIKTDLPLGNLPLRIYADVASFADAKQINQSGNAVLFNAGLELHLFDELLSIYAPIVMSSEYSDYLSEIYPKGKFGKSISFSLNIQNINWLRTNEYVFDNISQ